MRSLWIVLLLCVPFASAQDSAMLFRVGQTRDDVVAAHGKPKLFYVATTNEYLRSEEKAAGQGWPYSDVYERKTPHGKYEVHVWYTRNDKVTRLRRVDFVPEKVVGWKEVANDITELKEICADQCNVAAVKFGYWSIDIFAPNATPDVIDMLAKAQYGSFERGKANAYYEYRPGAQLTWDVDWTSIDKPKKKQSVPKDWNKAEIDLVMLGYVETKLAFHAGARSPNQDPAPISIAVWRP